MANWSEAKPQPSDQVRELGSLVRDNKTHLDDALQKHFYWSDSTLSAGVARFSDATGTFRAYWGTSSSFSTTGDSGRLMVTSDGATTWGASSYASLRATNFEGAITLSSANVVVRDAAGSAPATDVMHVIETGSSETRASGTFNNLFTAPFSAAPTVFLTEKDVSARYLVGVSAVNASGFSSQHSSLVAEPTSGMSSVIMWWAEGTIAL